MEQQFGCCLCNKTFDHRLSLKVHAYSHMRQKPLRCIKCDRGFSRRDRLKLHRRRRPDEKPFKYHLCHQHLDLRPSLSVHITSHTRERPHECEICHKSYLFKKKLELHSKRHTCNYPQKYGLRCKSITQSDNMTAHEVSRAIDKLHKCKVCVKVFSSDLFLKRHVQMKHTGDQKQHKCTFCGKICKQSGQLTVHVRKHTGEEPYKCGICRKGFKASSVLTRHLLTHSGDKSQKCSKCSASFALRSALKRHLKTHTGNKPYICKTCESSFARNSDLTRHMRGHSGEKGFMCKVCHKAYTRNSYLQKHFMRNHTGETPYKMISPSRPSALDSEVHVDEHSTNNETNPHDTMSSINDVAYLQFSSNPDIEPADKISMKEKQRTFLNQFGLVPKMCNRHMERASCKGKFAQKTKQMVLSAKILRVDISSPLGIELGKIFLMRRKLPVNKVCIADYEKFCVMSNTQRTTKPCRVLVHRMNLLCDEDVRGHPRTDTTVECNESKKTEEYCDASTLQRMIPCSVLLRRCDS